MADTQLVMNVLADNQASSTLQRVANGVDRIDNNVSEVNQTLGGMRGAFAVARAKGLGMVGAVGGAIGSLPAVASVASAGIVAALGGGLAAVGLAAAAQSSKVQSEFTATKNHITTILQQISSPFESTLTSIAGMARRTFSDFAPELSRAFQQMAPAITRFASQVFKAFRQLQPAIGPITDAFTTLLDRIGPKLPGIFSSISSAVIQVANAVSGNTGTITRLVTVLGKTVSIGLRVLAFLTRFPAVAMGAVVILGVLAAAFGGPITAIAGVIAAISALVAWVVARFPQIKNFITGAWNAVVNATQAAWDWIVSTAVGAMTRIVGFFSRLPGRIGRALGNVTGWLYNTGRDIVTGMWNGLMSMGGWLASQLWSWVRDVIPGPIEKALGISSPSRVMAEVGKNVGQGLAEGMQASTRDVSDASRQMARAAMVDDAAAAAASGVTAGGRAGGRRAGATAARSRATQTVELQFSGPEEMKKLIRGVVRKDGQGDVQMALGQ